MQIVDWYWYRPTKKKSKPFSSKQSLLSVAMEASIYGENCAVVQAGMCDKHQRILKSFCIVRSVIC